MSLSWKVFSKYGVAIWPYEGRGKHQLSFNRGDEFQIQEAGKGWYKGLLLHSRKKGIFPANYLRLQDSSGKNKDPQPVDKKPILRETADVLKELTTMWKAFYAEQKMSQFTELKDRMDEIYQWRNVIASPLCSEYEYIELKKKLLEKINSCNKLLKLDYLVRKPSGEISNSKNTPIVELFHNHRGGINALMEKRTGRKIKQQTEDENNFLDQKTCHILLDVRSVICAVDGDNDCYFSLYSRQQDKFITEEFSIRYMASGLTHSFESQNLNELKCIFKDVAEKEIESELYLVCRLVVYAHLGKKAEKKKRNVKEIPKYRRPFGCAVLLLTPTVLKSQAGKEHRMIIYHNPSQETSFPLLHESIIGGLGGYEQVPKSIGIDVAVNASYSDFAKFSSDNAGVSIINKLSFGDYIPPNEDRNDLYITIASGEFKQDSNAARNIIVEMEVRMEDGKVVPDCIQLGIGNNKPKDQYKSFVYYHRSDPLWNERVLVRVPVDLFDKVHLYFSFRHCSASEGNSKDDKPFSFAFKKLVEADETILKDGPHTLTTYKPNTKVMNDQTYYLRDNISGNQKLLLSRNKDIFTIRSYFVSTKLTQNLSLLALLKWKTYPSDLANILNKFTYIEQNEIMKFLREIFDALFSILAEKTEMAQLVYNAIVFIIGILVDDKTAKFTKFRPILDVYIRHHFSSEAAHRMLLMVLKQYMEKQDEISSASQIRSSMKALEFLFKFMIASRLLFKKHKPYAPDAPFKREMRELLTLINNLMARTSPEWVIGAKVIALKSTTLFDELGKVFERKELAGIACKLIDSVAESTKRHVNVEKLNLILSLVTGPLFEQEDSRHILIPTVLNHIKKHMGCSTLETSLCTVIMLSAVDMIESKTEKPAMSMLELLSMVDICSDYLENVVGGDGTSDDNEVTQDVITVYLTMFHYYPTRAIAKIIEKKTNRQEFIEQILKMLIFLLDRNPYQNNWRELNFWSYTVITKLFRIIAGYLKAHFNERIFKEFFHDLVKMIILKSLKMNKFTDQKREYVLSNYGDLRIDCCNLMKSVWEDHEDRKVLFLTDFVPLFLELLKIRNSDIQEFGINLYFTLVQKEYELEGAFSKVSNATIDSLNVITDLRQGAKEVDKEVDGDDESQLKDLPAMAKLDAPEEEEESSWGDMTFSEFKELFVEKLRTKFQVSGKDLVERGEDFLSDLNKVVHLMNELQSFPETAEYEYERTHAILQLMDYLKKTERMKSYIHFVHELKDLHIKLQNYVEAGNALLLHEELLTYRDMPIEQFKLYPAKTEETLKEALMLEAVDFLDKGKDWEKGIELIQSLKELYRNKWFDYAKLSGILQKESVFYKNIIDNARFYAEYFRCGFYGSGFDEYTRNKIFICKTNELEKFIEFQARIMERYPDCEILQSNKPPEKDILEGDKMYVQIVNCKPCTGSEFKHEPTEAEDENIPTRISGYSKNMGIQHYVFARPFHKGKRTKNEFETLWTSRTFYKTVGTFPTYHRRTEVVETRELEVTPFENALISMATKNKEIRVLIKKYTDPATRGDVSSFSMALSGVIDAQVNGGPDMYKQAFLKEPFLTEQPENVAELEFRLKEQLNIIKEGLKLHAKIVSVEMRPFHMQLEERFKVTMEQQRVKEAGIEAGKNAAEGEAAVSESGSVDAGDSVASGVEEGESSSEPTGEAPETPEDAGENP